MNTTMLDKKEEKALLNLDEKYQKFIEPSLISKGLEIVKEGGKKVIPEIIRENVEGIQDYISESTVWKKVMKMAADGFIVLQEISAKYTINEKSIIEKMNNFDNQIFSLNDFYKLKSYEIEKIINSNDWKVYSQNILQAAPTGTMGIAGLPFNIILSTFIQFRAVQSIAMHYGYDVKSNSAEMDYAGEVLLQILMKGRVSDASECGEIIAKMMTQAELSSLRRALQTKTYEQMAKEGGIQLLYAQMRAITNKAAQKALEKAGEKGIENKVLSKILEALSRKMSQEAGAKAIPGIAIVFNILIDTHQIHNVTTMANVIYQKRFLMDKEMRNNDSDSSI